MDAMAKSLFSMTFITVLLLGVCGSTAFSEVHICKVTSIPPSTHQHENMTLITFDLIRLPSTTVSANGVPETTATSSQLNSTSSEKLTTTETNGTSQYNASIANKITTIETTQQPLTNENERTSPNNNEKIRSDDDTRVGNSTTRAPEANIRMGSSTTGAPEDNTGCRCRFDSNSTTRISILQLWLENRSEPLQLQINDASTTEAIRKNEAWARTFTNTTVELSVANNAVMLPYRLVMEVKGNFSSVTCTGPVFISSVRRAEVIKDEHKELVFEAPLLIIAAAMAVIGLLLLITGIAIWRRYRAERKKQAKAIKKHQEMELRELNYEVISNDGGEQSNEYFKKENEDATRKDSTYSISKMRYKRKDSSSSKSQSPDVAQRGKYLGGKLRSSDTEPQKKLKADRRKKKKHDKISRKKHEKINAVDDSDEDTYSRVQQEYEDVSDGLMLSPTTRDCRVATPLLLVMNSGVKQNPLRKTENCSEAQTKARKMQKMELPEMDSMYTHLNRTGKSHSYHVTDAQTYDDANSTARCKTTDVVSDNINMFKFPKLTSYVPKGIALKFTEEEGRTASISSKQDDQDHIYEAFEKEEAMAAENGHPESSQGNDNCAEEAKSENATAHSNDLADQEQCITERKTTGANESDSAAVHYDDGTESLSDNKSKTENEPAFMSDEEARVDQESGRLSTVNIIPVQMSANRDRQSDAVFQTSPNEVQKDIMSCGKSNSDGGDLNNGSVSPDILSNETLEDREVKTLNITPSETNANASVHSMKDTINQDGSEDCIIVDNIVYESLAVL